MGKQDGSIALSQKKNKKNSPNIQQKKKTFKSRMKGFERTTSKHNTKRPTEAAASVEL